MEFVPILVAVAMVAVIIDIVRSARGQDWNGVVTPLAAALAGIGVAFVLGESDFGEGISIGDTGETFGSVNGASLILLGFGLGSLAAKGVDLLKAVDNSDTQRKPHLIDNDNADRPDA